MRVVLDATPLVEPYGGIPRYVCELTAALAEAYPGDEFHLLSDQSRLHVEERLRRLANVVVETTPRRFFGKYWSAGLPWELRRRKADLFHGADFAVPYLPVVPSVMTVHDLSPWKPEPIRPPGSDRVRIRAPRLMPIARRIVTPSEAVRREVIEEFSVSPERVTATPLAPSKGLYPLAEGAVTERLHSLGVERPYLIALGGGGPRKNLPLAIETWSRVRQSVPELGLVLAGGARVQIERTGLLHMAPVADEDLRILLAGSEALLYPSLYEGFGLPVVEAMQAGAAVVASSDPALVETAAGAAVHCPADSPDRWRSEVERILRDRDHAADLRRRGRERAAELSWAETARKTHQIYEEALG